MKELIEEFNKLKEIAKTKFDIKNKKIKKLSLSFELSSIRILGCYSHEEKTIYLNKKIAEINPKKFKSVLIHEFAHFLTTNLFPEAQPHGKEWKNIMIKLGSKIPRAKDSSFQKELQTAYKSSFVLFKCKCQEHFLKKTKANQILNKEIKCYCSKCGTRLKLKSLPTNF